MGEFAAEPPMFTLSSVIHACTPAFTWILVVVAVPLVTLVNVSGVLVRIWMVVPSSL